MSLSFFITLSLLSSQAFLSKKLLPSPYEITHLLQKDSLKKSDQKLVNILLNQDQKPDSFNPGLIYEIIDKNQNYQEIIQDIKTNYQQVSNKELTKKRSKSSSSKKIFESFAKWQTSFNFNKAYSIYHFAKQYLEKDPPKLSQNEINSLVKDLKDNKALYHKIIGNFWDNTKKNEEKKLTSFLKSNKKAWNLIDFLINNKKTKLYSDWKNQLTIDQKKMLFKYSEMLKKESVLDFIKNSLDFNAETLKHIWNGIDAVSFNQWNKLFWKSNNIVYLKEILKWDIRMINPFDVRVNVFNRISFDHVNKVYQGLQKHQNFIEKLFNKYKKQPQSQNWLKKWKDSDEYKQKNKEKVIKYGTTPQYKKDFMAWDLKKWNKNIKKEKEDKTKTIFLKYPLTNESFVAFIAKNFYFARKKDEAFGKMKNYYRVELNDNDYVMIEYGKKVTNGDNIDRGIFKWIAKKKNDLYPSVIKFIFDRSIILIKEDGILSVEGLSLSHRYKLDEVKINSIFSKWNQIKDNDINTNLLSSALLKTNLKPTLKSIIDDFVKFASQNQNQIKNNKQLNQQASKRLLGIITHIAKTLSSDPRLTLSSDPKLKESYAKWNLSYKNKKWEWDDLESLLNKGKKKNWKDRKIIKQIKNHFQDFFKKKFTLDENLREYFVKHCIKEIILSNKDLETKQFLTKWYQKNKKVDDLKANYQKYLEKA